MNNSIYYFVPIVFLTAMVVLIIMIRPDDFSISNAQEEQVSLEIMDTSAIEEREVYLSNISINYLRSLEIDSEAPIIEEELSASGNYKKYVASYTSEGNKIYGLLTIPNEDPPEGGFSAVVLNHGYIPPNQYKTTEKYMAYVDFLARNGFVVFKIDMRGHGNSEGSPTGSYFSPGYTIDAISALKSLQKLVMVNPDKIGMWGHSMSGNLILRAMLVEEDVKASVIWAGAVYSYEDYSKYRLNDASYVRRPTREAFEDDEEGEQPQSFISKEVSKLRSNPKDIDFNNEFWISIAMTSNLEYLNSPIQLHHAVNDPVVNVGYSRDLANILNKENKKYELYEYEGGGHNINSPYFETAMQRTVDFFKKNLGDENIAEK